MKTLRSEPELSAPIGRQIQKHVRGLIAKGELAPGDRLPSTQELAETWQTHVNTVQRALTPLVRQGLLTRTRRVGTFVRKITPSLTCVGVYYPSDFWLQKTFAFYGVLHSELRQQLQQSRVGLTTVADPRNPSQQNDSLESLVNAAKNREIQALIIPCINKEHYAWLREVPVPNACVWPISVPTAVAVSLRQFVELSLQRVKDQGCRSVGLISAELMIDLGNVFDGAGVKFYEYFREQAAAMGLKVQPQWIRGHTNDMAGTQHAQYGYDEFHALWARHDRPEALVIWPDSIASGVLMAIAKHSVNVPQDLKLVFHKNDQVDLFCPVTASFVVTRIEEVASALLEQIRKQLKGERCRPMLVPMHLQD